MKYKKLQVKTQVIDETKNKIIYAGFALLACLMAMTCALLN